MSPSNNFLETLPVTNEIQAGTSLNLTVLSNKPMPDLHYQIFVRDESVEDGIFHVNNKSMATMTIPVTQLMFPRAHVLVYHFLDDGEAVGDITSFDVGNSAKNKLKVEFSKSQTRPGDNVNLQANGPAGATIYVTAVDKSVLILGNNNEMTRSRYTNKLLEHYVTPDGKTTDDMLTHEGIQIIVSQTDINECYFRPCLNGGTCSDSLPGYACHCPVDVTGKNCESIMGCRLYPCQHGGTCQHIQYDPWYTCICPHFITGTNCEHVTECFRQPCQNNGTCIVLPSGHRCQCPQYIVGDNCEVVTDCYSRPCQNGGTCQMTSLGYTCICYRSNTGRNCESFTGLPTASPIPGQTGLPAASFGWPQKSGTPTAAFPWHGQSGLPTASLTMTPSVTLHPPTGDVLLGKTRSRTNFMDTLLWTNTTLGSTGTVDIPVRLGDTVTTWVASAFAMSLTYGLSITSGYAEILSSLKFFVSLITPDHIIFGEKIILQPVVYNYMGSEIPITLIIENSVSQDKVYRNGQIKHGESLSFTVPTSFTTLGTVTVKITAIGLLSNVRDTVVKEIQVKPQGAPQHYNFPVVIDLNAASSLSTAVDVVLPASVIKGSVKVKAKLSGEILASSIHGLGQLVTYPSGCGEQTMIGLSPDIYIAKYLTATGQMTADLKDKIVAYIKEGYQHELTYQLSDDSFSTFTSNTIGSTWLTAFVIGSFKEAKSFTYVSDDIIIHALDWLMGQQNSDGSFREPHALYHKDMQGGTKSTVALTAYITIALEASKNFQGETRRSLADALKLALHYLQEQYTSLDDNHAHALALTAYAFTITGTSFSSVLVNKLNAIAHIDGQIKYWTASKTTTVTKREPWKEGQRFGRPIDIETSAYALLAHTARGELGEGLKVMKWIVQQRNPNGGFTSTQDTVVALKALSEFHTALHQATSPSSPHHVHIAATIATTGFSKNFQIDDSNINVLHEVELPVDSGSVNITASGSGLGVVEVAVFYNVDAADGNAAFDLTATVIKESVQSITVHVCASWKLADSSGMAVIQVGIPTGFEPDVSLIKETNGLKKKEYKSGTVDIYFEQIGRSPLCVDVTANRVGMTVQTQKSQVLVFDYYNPVNQQSVFYLSSALHDAKLCDICPTCTGCGDLIIGK
ncbi:CD109 antigen-like isoform X1 [Haliotis rufescens]|uniref:CD109 antigen-like isoform X1 n=1 Tax=Haliotis rufescens TaxID=6454 RepID=UPI00201FA300|nr:CD109 antigen-like isoform X1 [Haliotis rufescens]